MRHRTTPLTLTLLALLAGCTNESGTRNAVHAMGMTKVRITGYRFFQCGESDFSHTGFEAVNAQGQHVEGTVCCGLFFKACTVRF